MCLCALCFLRESLDLLFNTTAAALINILKGEQSKSRSFSDATSLHYPFESERIVLHAHTRRGVSEELDSADVKPYEILPQTEFPPLIPAHQTPESKVRLKSTSKLESMFPEPPVLSENDDFVGDFSGGKPLIGEYRQKMSTVVPLFLGG